jgi:hypothetical protein
MIGLKTSVLLLMRVFKVKRCAFRNFINDDNYNQTKKQNKTIRNRNEEYVYTGSIDIFSFTGHSFVFDYPYLYDAINCSIS